jgi:geranylgeranyl pyrophosphate synthase
MTLFPTTPTVDTDLVQVGVVIAERLRGRPIVEQIAGPRLIQNGRGRLLASLVLLAARIGHYDAGRSRHAAVAIQLIDTALSLHSGLVDTGARRRADVQSWPGLDGNIALMVGDYLLTLAAAEMAQDPDSRIITYYSQSVMSFSEAALAPVVAEQPAVALEQYMAHVSRGAAVLFEAACKAGAVCCSLTQGQIDTLGRYGQALGVALRIIDDVRDVRADGHLLQAGLITLPLIYAAEAEGSQPIAEFRPADPAHLARRLSEIQRLGADGRALGEGQRWAAKAAAAILELPESEGRGGLAAIAVWAGNSLRPRAQDPGP